MNRPVFLIWRPWLAAVQIKIAERLARLGWDVHLYVLRQPDIAIVRARFPEGALKSITAFQIVYDVARMPAANEAAEVSRALELERWLGVTFSSLCVADRHLGRGFSVGAPRFPSSAPSRADRAQTLAAISSQIEFWRGEFEKKKPVLILEADQFTAAVAHRRGVPLRVLAASRHANLYYWAEDVLFRKPAIEAAYHRLSNEATEPDAIEIEQAHAVVSYWRTAMKITTMSHFVRLAGYQIAQRAWHWARRSGLASTYDLFDEVVYLWRSRRQARLMTGPRVKRLKDIEGQRFVFFPLATEPEVTLQGLSPEFFFQLEAIAMIARDLPADTILAVKEHQPACGARDDLFYDQIWAFKNVVILDMREPGPSVVRAAAATITVAGSAGFEAAAMGKPTIVFGRHNLYRFLPHVWQVEDPARLRHAIDQALDGPSLTARVDGRRFLSAVASVSFDLETFDPFAKEPVVADACADAAVADLLEGLGIARSSTAEAPGAGS